MPLYFDHCNYHSFNRLVNAWSFRRMSSGPDRGSYYHELFLRGRPSLHRLMHRLPKSQKKAPMSKSDEPDFYSMPRMDALVPSNNPATSPAALAAAAAMPAASVSMSAMSAKLAGAASGGGMNMNNLAGINNNLAGNMNMNMAALTSDLAAETNDVGQLSLMGLQQGMGMGMGMFGNQNNLLGMEGGNNMGESTNNNDMDGNAAIQAAMARIAQQQLAERAQMSSLLGMGAGDPTTNVFQQQSSLLSNEGQMRQQPQSDNLLQQQQDQVHQQEFTPSLEANLRATQLEHDRLQQQIAALQAQQQAIANEQLQLQQFQQQAASITSNQQQMLQQFEQLNEASLQSQQESKMSSPLLSAAATADAGKPTGQVANSPAAKSG